MFDALEHKFRRTEQSDLISRLYEGKMMDYVRCLECQTEKAREDTFLGIFELDFLTISFKFIFNLTSSRYSVARPAIWFPDCLLVRWRGSKGLRSSWNAGWEQPILVRSLWQKVWRSQGTQVLSLPLPTNLTFKTLRFRLHNASSCETQRQSHFSRIHQFGFLPCPTWPASPTWCS